MGSHGGIAPRYFLVFNWGLLNWHSEGWKPHGEQGRPCCLVKPDLSPRPAGLASASGAGMRAWEVPWIGLWPYPVLRKLLNLIHSPVSCAWAEPGHPCLPSYTRLYAVPGHTLGFAGGERCSAQSCPRSGGGAVLAEVPCLHISGHLSCPRLLLPRPLVIP